MGLDITAYKNLKEIEFILDEYDENDGYCEYIPKDETIEDYAQL